jgi:CTP:molybdopterin cytidylyltransferase MocA
VLVVTGAADLPLPPAVRRVRNDAWADGQATSLQAAVRAAEGYDALVVGLGDQPLVEPEAWRRVAAVDAPLAYATYDGVRGNPVRLGREIWPLLPTEGDEGARRLLQERADLAVPVACPGNPLDIDTQEDLAPWS